MISPEQDKKDLLAYLDELQKRRLPRFSERAAAIPSGEFGSTEWFKEVGDYWRETRENIGLSRYELAGKVGIHINRIRFLEEGLAYPEELQGDILSQLSHGLTGDALPFEYFSQRYNVTEIPVKTPRFKLLPFIASRWISMNKAS